MFFILKYDTISLFRLKRLLFIPLGVLVMILASVGYAKQNQPEADMTENKIIIGVVDEDNSIYSKLILSFLEDNDVFADYAHIIYGEEDALIKDLKADHLTLLIVIPENFASNMIRIKNMPVRVTINSSDTTKALLVQNLLSSYEEYIKAVQINCVTLYDIMEQDGLPQELIDSKNMEISYDLVSTVLGKNDFIERIVVDEIVNIPLSRYYGYELLFLIILYVSMACGIRIMKEQRAGILVRLKTTGVKTYWFLIEKLLLYSIIIWLLFAGIYAVRTIVFLYQFSMEALLFCAMAGALFASFSIAFTSFFSSMQSYLLAANMINIFVLVIGGGIIPILYLPQSMISIAKFTPNYWFIILLSAIENGSPTKSLRFSLWALLFIVIFIAVGMFFYDRKEGHAYAD